jgi:protein TonB
MSGRIASLARWGACFTLVLGAHAAAAVALLDWHTPVASIAGAPAILIDLAPAPAAPAVKTSALPPGPQRPQARATPAPKPKPNKPIEKAELTPAPNKPVATSEAKPAPEPAPNPHPKSHPKPQPAPAPAKLVTGTIPAPPAPKVDETKVDEVLTALPPPRPHIVPHKREAKSRHAKPHRARPHRVASLASAPSAAARHAARTVAPAPGAAHPDPHALANWQSRLLGRLERYKRYPDEAQAHGEHGTARLAFSVDRRGGVHGVRILRSSGSALLDRAAVALPRRAAPLPPPPAGLGGRRIPIVVPIRYSIR